MSGPDSDSVSPRAVVHRRILDVAAERPDATLAEIAAEVGPATPDLVDDVLAEYGDPSESAGGETGAEPDPGSGTDDKTEGSAGMEDGNSEGEKADGGAKPPGSAPEGESPVDTPELSEEQVETLRAVHEHPDETQGELAERLDVSRTTVSRRLIDVPGFSWPDRAAYTAALFGSEPSRTDGPAGRAADGSDSDSKSAGGAARGEGGATTTGPADQSAAADGGVEERAVADALDRVEQRLAALETAAEGKPGACDGASLPPELAHKVVHAAMESDRVSEEEELRLLEELLS